MNVKRKPDGYHTLTPFLVVDDIQQIIDYTAQAFNGELMECIKDNQGKIMFAEVQIGDSRLMLSPSKEQFKAMPSALYLYVEDTDLTYKRAIDAGGTSIMEPGNQFYGDRNAGVQGPSGNFWWIATHVEDIAPEELQERANAFYSQA